MDNEVKTEIEKLGLQEFPKKEAPKPERPTTVPEEIEKITSAEALSAERRVEKIEADLSQEGGGSREKAGGIVAQSQATQSLQEREKEIERILSYGLADLYVKMTPEKQQEFKRVGEETTQRINAMLSETKIKVKKIISLIRNWLSMIPGVNSFFLEQETKIRTDKVMKIKKD